ncbi:MAG: hypothetical protein HYV96_08110 [Opitutae bacterium]|nr:hypothetical protein [Opitutae bacterium]
MSIVAYLAGLDRARTLLWSAFGWYLIMILRHPPGSFDAWANAAGIAVVVGAILLANADHAGVSPQKLGFWPIARFFLIPFCVSSFSTAMRASGLVLIFSRDMNDNLWGVGAVAGLLATRWSARLWRAAQRS